jgi:regulator of sigma E protease
MGLVLTLVILSLLVFVHEAGHFVMAKRAGIRVLEFGFGYPPRLFGKKIGETIYSINLLPIGGFVRLYGEEEEDIAQLTKHKAREDFERIAFFTQPKRVRVAVLLAGVVMNCLLGVLLFSAIYTSIGIPAAKPETVQIVGKSTNEDAPAYSAFELGDEVVSVDGQPIDSTHGFQLLIQENRGKDLNFELIRGGETVFVKATPRSEVPAEYGPATLMISPETKRLSCVRPLYKEGPLGVVISPKIEMERFPLWQMPFRGAWFGLVQAYGWGSNIVGALGGILAQMACGSIPEDVGGPVEIGYLVSEVSKEGIVPLANLVAVLSINLAVINLLPIPALDGGRLVFVGIEALIGKKLSPRAERLTHAVGMALLLALMLAITVQDILRRSGAESLGALVERVVSL